MEVPGSTSEELRVAMANNERKTLWESRVSVFDNCQI